MANTFDFIGKPRQFKRVKMVKLLEFQTKMKEEMSKEKDQEKAVLKAGKMLEEFITPFKAEEMLEADPDDFYVSQGIHLIHSYVKRGRSKEEIEQLKNNIIDTAIQNQLTSFQPVQKA